MNIKKIRNGTYAQTIAHQADWEEGMEINLIDKGLPIPADKVNGADSVDKDKVVKVNAEGQYVLGADSTGNVTDVQINGTTIVDAQGVANIPFAGSSAGGVFKTGSSVLVGATSGTIQAQTRTYESYAGVGNEHFIAKGTLENVLDNVSVRFDKSLTITDAQKTTACNNIGAQEEIDVLVSDNI